MIAAFFFLALETTPDTLDSVVGVWADEEVDGVCALSLIVAQTGSERPTLVPGDVALVGGADGGVCVSSSGLMDSR
jgi:hypothetical protein